MTDTKIAAIPKNPSGTWANCLWKTSNGVAHIDVYALSPRETRWLCACALTRNSVNVLNGKICAKQRVHPRIHHLRARCEYRFLRIAIQTMCGVHFSSDSCSCCWYHYTNHEDAEEAKMAAVKKRAAKKAPAKKRTAKKAAPAKKRVAKKTTARKAPAKRRATRR